ncbi:MAG: tRNA (N6-isopentenyl adenosine(37)-C2)-methylthiotransferase MiaB [Elusimicrobiota bacterium]
MRLHTISLGCQMSAADGDEMAEPLRRRGWSSAEAPEGSDAILISTCTVRQHAEDRALSLIGSLKPWKEADPKRVLIVAGCAAERLGPWIQKRFPYVDLVVGSKSIEQYPQILEAALSYRFDAFAEEAAAFSATPGQAFASPTGSEVTAFVTIMRGCNYSCSYCIVPAVRGRELYRLAADVLAEARLKVAAGAREITLLGQTVNSYAGSFEGQPLRFPGLLRLLDRVEGLERIRFMSPHPHYLDAEMIAAMKECPTVCEQLHLPVQSGSDRILKLMKRGHGRAAYLDKVSALRRALPKVVFSTDIIVGFPTETEEDFKETLSLVEALGPASAYTFKYSPRDSTEAAARPDDVAQEVKEERLARLNDCVDQLTNKAMAAQLGTVVSVLAEQETFGKTRTGFKTTWTSAVAPGALVDVKLSTMTRRTLRGEIDEP